jgi:hypothetical protein
VHVEPKAPVEESLPKPESKPKKHEPKREPKIERVEKKPPTNIKQTKVVVTKAEPTRDFRHKERGEPVYQVKKPAQVVPEADTSKPVEPHKDLKNEVKSFFNMSKQTRKFLTHPKRLRKKPSQKLPLPSPSLRKNLKES